MIEIPRGGLVFVCEGEKVHQVENRCEKFLERHRGAVTTSERLSSRLDYKGASLWVRTRDLQTEAYSRDAATQIVTGEVGHNRIEVISIYTNEK